MRILMMADAPPRPDSGAAGTEIQTAAALRRLGHEVEEVWTDLLPRRIAHGNLRYLLELPALYRREMLRRVQGPQRYDVVHVNQPHGYLAARALRNLAARPVFVHRSHGYEPRVRTAMRRCASTNSASRAGWRALATPILAQALRLNELGIERWADGHIVSSSLCGDWLAHDGVPREHIAVIAQGVPGAFIEAPAAPLDAARLLRVLHVGQFAPVKGPDIVARAFDLVAAGNPDAHLTWVCDARDHEAAATLLTPAARARTTFLPWMKQDELLPVYDVHGVFLFPSYFEGFGKAFLEAMSRGLVVVASDEGGAHDLVVSGTNGHLTPVGDAQRVADAVLSAQRDAQAAARMGDAARSVAMTHTWDRAAGETAAFYERLIALQRG